MTDISTESANMYDYKITDQKLIKANGDNYIPIYENDLKYRKHKDIDLSRVKNVKHYDRDTLDYRFHESNKDNHKSLDLSHLGLKSFPNIPKQIANEVKYLFLSENAFEQLPDLSFMENLVVVDLCSNNLSSIPKFPDTIEEILIKNNNISNINSLAQYHFLKRLDCSNNMIGEIPIIDSLDILICENNQIKNIPTHLKKLRKLLCSKNEIKSITGLVSLEILEIDHNKLERIEDVPRLKELYCSNNIISSLSDLNKIEIIHCFDTNIRKLSYYYSLKELACDYTKEMMLSKLYKIESSDIMYGKIMILTFK